MVEHSYIERGFQASGIKDGQFNNLNELEQHTHAVNDVMRQGYLRFEHDAKSGLLVPDTHDIYGFVDPSHTQHEQQLNDGIDSLQRSIDMRKTDLSEIMQAYALADVRAELFLQDRPEILNDEIEQAHYRAAFRIAALPGAARFVFDIDNTITVENPEYPYYEKLVPGTEFADPYMASHEKGREVFASVHPRGWAQVQDRLPETFQSVGSLVQLRPYMDELIGSLKDDGCSVEVLTAGMAPLAAGILGQLKKSGSRIDKVHSIRTDDVTSNYKALSLKHIALLSPDYPIAFVGDGSSDRPAAQKDVPAAVRYALAGGGFERALKETRQVYIPFTTGRDIQTSDAKIRRIIDTEVADMVKSAA